MKDEIFIQMQPIDEFFVWYRNGCTSGLNLEQAQTKFELLSDEKQQELRSEYDNNRIIIQERNSGWTAPFAG